MRRAVAQIVVLVWEKGVGNFRIQTAGHGVVGVRVIRSDVGGANVNFCAQCPKHVHFFFGLLVAHGANEAVSLNAGGQGQAHTGISRRALNNGAAGFQQPRAFGVFHHLKRHAVFGRMTRIEVLHLGEHRTGKIRRNGIQSNHGCTANGVQYRRRNRREQWIHF